MTTKKESRPFYRMSSSVALVLFSAAAILTGSALGQPGTIPETVRCADSLLSSLQEEFGLSGMAVAVRQGDAVVYNRAFGDAHVELGTPVTSSTIFQLSSSAKLFAGLVTMRLVEQGKISLDDSVTSYLPGAPVGWKPITLRHLASMTARLPDLSETVIGEDNEDALKLLGRIAEQESSEMLAALFAMAPEPDPGTGWKYGGGDFFVLQQVLERVAGKPFERLVDELIFQPAGMTSARYWSSDREVVPGAATGYYPDGQGGLVQREFIFPQVLFAAGGAAASLEDLLRLDEALLRAGRLLSKESIDTMWTWQPLANGQVASYGIGWDVKDHAPRQYSAGHSGGFLTTYRHYETGDLTVIVLTNGFTIDYEYMSPDNIATATAAVWKPEIAGLEEPGCNVEAIKKATF